MKALRILLCVVVATLFFAQMSSAEVTVGANVEINTDFATSTEEAEGGDVDLSKFEQGGRVKVTVEGKTEADSGMYAALKADLLVKDDGSFGADDAYFELGSASWFLKAGRQEGEGLFGKGADIYIVGAPGAPGRYEANYSRGRGDIGFILAVMPSDTLTIEADIMYSSCDGDNIMGARPLVKLSTGSLTIKAGADYYLASPQNGDLENETTKFGFGGNAEFGMGTITLGGSAAMGIVGGKDDLGEDLDDATTLSVFGYMKMGVGAATLGVGGGMTMLEYDKAPDEDSMIEMYVSFDQPLPVDGAAIKLGASYAAATLENGAKQENSAFGGRVRLYYEL